MDLMMHFLAIFVCIVLSAFFSGSETALLRLPIADVERDAQHAKGPAVLAVRDLMGSTSRLLVTILVGNNVANIVGASVAAALAVRYLGEKTGIIVASTAMTLIILVFCEVLPKAVAARHPRGTSYAVALPLYLLHQLLWPLHRLFDLMIEPLVRMATGGAIGEVASTSEDILRLARLNPGGHAKGTPLGIIAATAGAAEMTVTEIMVPRTEVVAFAAKTPPAELLEQLLNERYTRAPIYDESIDNISGVVHLKDLVKLVRENGVDLDTILKPVLRVPERKPILRLLAEMQHAFVHVAVVKDGFGVTQGMVTQEDILEELVGEIRDEFDREELLTIRRRPDGSYQALGRVTVLDFNRETGSEIPSERGETLGGLVFNTLGHAPAKGDSVQVSGYDISVMDVSGSRITQVRVAQENGPASTNGHTTH
jgi:putative hemolysin